MYTRFEICKCAYIDLCILSLCICNFVFMHMCFCIYTCVNMNRCVYIIKTYK